MRRSEWMEVDWREHLRWVRIDGRWVNLVELGDRDAPPVVFVHGLSGSWQNWLENLPHFARDHRVIAPDLPGFGRSRMPAERISISGYAELLGKLLDELSVERASVVGNSMGGFIGAETAIASPDRVERLVLVTAAGLSIEHRRNDRALSALEALENVSQAVVATVVGRANWLACRPRGRKLLMWFVAAHPERLPGPLVYENAIGSSGPGFVQALDAMTSYPIRDRLDDVRCPTLIVWGEKDMLVPLRDAYEFDRLIADSRLVVYEDTGHVPQLERPEEFNRDVRAFLSERSDEPGGDGRGERSAREGVTATAR